MRKTRGELKQDAMLDGGNRYCCVAAAVIGSAVVGGIVSSSASSAASDASDRASESANTQARIGQEQWDRYKTVYAPLEDGMVADAQNFDTPQAYDQAASEAAASVNSSFGLERQRLTRTPGLDPSSAAAQAANSRLGLAQASTGASAQNTARTGIRDKAWARRIDALSLGKGLAATASGALASATAANSSLAANAQYQANNTASGVGGMVRDVVNSPSVKNWLTSSTTPTITPSYDPYQASISGGFTPQGL